MRRTAIILLIFAACAVLSGFASSYARAATVRALLLPAYTTIAPEGARVMMRVNASGIVAATVTMVGPYGGTPTGVIIWSASATPNLVRTATSLPPGELSADLELGGIGGAGTIYATLVKSYELEAGGTQTVPEVVQGSAESTISLKSCSASGTAIPSDFLPHVEDVVGFGLYLTYESPDSTEVLDGDQTSDFAPYAVLLQGTSCRVLARAAIRGANASYAVGYRGYLGTFIAPTDLDTDRQRYAAIRIHDGTLVELGPGVALAVSADGTAVGADAPPGIHESETMTLNGKSETFPCCTPHARLWRPDGSSVSLAPNAPRSVAYAIDDRGRVAGFLVDAKGAHRAFLWENGKLLLLDDIVHAAGWRFESVCAFGPGGELIGIGTLNGVATAFELSGAS